ncbi:YobI family P-loop NTPase [Holzapfeliella sp. JNUCC 80]
MMEKDKSKLIPLVPVDDADNIENYKHHLNRALKDGSVYNIALSGNYGSGKSSIISTYFKHNKQNDVLKISLANFSSDNTEEITKNIEKNIINQILYQIPTKRIPLTSFKVKREINRLQRSLFAIEILCLLTYLVNVPDFWLKLLRYVATAGFLFWNVTSVLKYLPIKKLNLKFQNVETEIMKQPDELFEKYADEIIYLLEKSGKHILVIEDLDRFEQINIFEKLRELNIKINNKLSQNSKINKNQSNFVFLYPIKDDLFQKNIDRTKFFDLIIPVIPHVNAYNSYEQMKKLLKGYKIDKKLLRELGYYIQDNRLLTNIYNEFVIYKEELNSEDKEKLLPLIVYKNLFPDDFEKAKKRQGLLYTVFDLKLQGITDLKSLLDEKEKELKDVNKEKNIKFFQQWLSDYGVYSYYEAEDLIRNPNNTFIYRSSDYGSQTLDYTDILQGKDDTEELKILQKSFDKETDKSNLLKDEIDKLKNDIKSNVMKNIITSSLINSKIEEEGLQESEDEKAMWFLYRMIKSGRIDEHYEMFINYDYGSTQDTQFMIDVRKYPNKARSMNIKLTDFVKIKSDLIEDDYTNTSILNYSFLEHCLNNDKDKAITILRTAKNSNTEFIEQYINESSSNGVDIIGYLKDLEYKLNLKSINYIEDEFIEHEVYIENDDNFAEILKNNWKEALTNQNLVEKLLSENGNVKLKKYLIKHLSTKVNLISGAETFFDDLILHNKVYLTVNNVSKYIEHQKDTNQTIIDFINSDSYFTSSKETYEDSSIAQIIIKDKRINISHPEKLALSKDIDKSIRKQIFLSRINDVNIDYLGDLLREFDFAEASKFEKIKNQTKNYFNNTIEISSENEIVLNKLRDCKKIRGFMESEKYAGRYKVIGIKQE